MIRPRYIPRLPRPISRLSRFLSRLPRFLSRRSRFLSRRSVYCCIAAVAILFCLACSSDALPPVADTLTPLTIAVDGESWQQADGSIAVTRAEDGATLSALKEYGFGLYCSDLSISNGEVRYSNSSWKYGKWQAPVEPSTESTFIPADTFWPQSQSATASFYAYAPFKSEISVSGNKLTFTATADNTTDLLWASDLGVKRGNAATLNFRHALTKLSIGSLSNQTSEDVTLTKITISDWFSSGTLNLEDGSWSDCTKSDTGHEIKSIDDNKTFYLIPGNKVEEAKNGETLTYYRVTIKIDILLEVGGKSLTVSSNVTLTQGESYTLNIVITNNHQVKIEE